MIEYRIRRASLADQDAVVTLWAACELIVPYNDPRADFRFALDKQGSDLLLAVDNCDGAIVGSVMVGHDGHRGWVYYVAAAPDHRHAGIGRAVMFAAEAWLRERGVRKVQLMVRETNTAVQAFYKRIGYKDTPRTVMAKWLKRNG